MSQSDNGDSGPSVQFEWNFPVMRMLSSRASRVSASVKARSGNVVGSDVKERFNSSHTETEETKEEQTVEDDDGQLDNIRDRLDDIRSGDGPLDIGDGPLNLGGGDTVTSYDDGVFVPVRTQTDVGEEVTWVNESDSSITILFNDRVTLDVQPGDSATREFDTERALEYSVQGTPNEETCGVVLVGDVEAPNLPCETDEDRELLDEDGTTTVSAPPSMDVAADKKEEMRNDLS